jgi:protein-disulfide isomerase
MLLEARTNEIRTALANGTSVLDEYSEALAAFSDRSTEERTEQALRSWRSLQDQQREIASINTRVRALLTQQQFQGAHQARARAQIPNVMARAASFRDVYYAQECGAFGPGREEPGQSFAAPVSPFGEPVERFTAHCNPVTGDVLVRAGASDALVYNTVFHRDPRTGGWTPVRLVPAPGAHEVGSWIVGRAYAELSSFEDSGLNTHHVLGYQCQRVDETWKCGCADQSCARPSWSYQRVTPLPALAELEEAHAAIREEERRQSTLSVRDFSITDDHYVGDVTDPDVVIVTYTDLQCLFCAGFHQIMMNVLSSYGESGGVLWVIRHHPLTSLHEHARTLARSSVCVAEVGGNETAITYMEDVYERFQERTGFVEDEMDLVAREYGIDPDAYRLCMRSDRPDQRIDADIREAKEVLGLEGTPHSVLSNGFEEVVLPGALSRETVIEVLEQLLR